MEANYSLRIKTGFFKTTLYKFDVRKGVIELIPKDSNEDTILLKENDIILISLRKKDEIYVNFNLVDSIITGILVDIKDGQRIFKLLKENINRNIIYEED